MVLHNVLQRTDDCSHITPLCTSQGDSRCDEPAIFESVIRAEFLEGIERRLVVVVDFHCAFGGTLERGDEAILFVDDNVACGKVQFVCVHGVSPV